jgi:hypothetical protein
VVLPASSGSFSVSFSIRDTAGTHKSGLMLSHVRAVHEEDIEQGSAMQAAVQQLQQ